MLMQKKIKIGLILSVFVVGLLILQSQRIQELPNQSSNKLRIIVLSEELCHNCKHGVINSHWENNDLIIEGIFSVNCCPEKIIYEYELINNDLSIVLKDEGICNCMGKQKTILKIQNLKKKDYNIILRYETLKEIQMES